MFQCEIIPLKYIFFKEVLRREGKVIFILLWPQSSVTPWDTESHCHTLGRGDSRWQFTNLLLWVILSFPSGATLPSPRIIYLAEFEKQTGTFVKLFSHFWLWIAASCRNPKIYFLKIFISSPDFFLYDVIGIQLLVYKKA